MKKTKTPKFQLRGCSWFSYNTDHLRTHYRYRLKPGDVRNNPGFRCASAERNPTVQRFVRIA